MIVIISGPYAAIKFLRFSWCRGEARSFLSEGQPGQKAQSPGAEMETNESHLVMRG